MASTSGMRLELTWPNKDKFLLSPKDQTGKPVWVERTHPAASEVRLIDFTGECGQVAPMDQAVTDNLLFTGDSLDVLRVLTEHPRFRREYRGKIKCVYIDPPFNTGRTFDHYDDWLEHSTWLSFMRDRLLHLVGRRLPLKHIDDPDFDWDSVLTSVQSLTDSVLDELTGHVEEYYSGNYITSLFKNAARCNDIVTALSPTEVKTTSRPPDSLGPTPGDPGTGAKAAGDEEAASLDTGNDR